MSREKRPDGSRAALQRGVAILYQQHKCVPDEYPFGEYDDDYNCWGLTSFLKGWDVGEPYWVSEKTMKARLCSKTVEVSTADAQVGDIIVFGQGDLNSGDSYSLEHTAVIIDVGKNQSPDNWVYIHKPGPCAPAVCQFGFDEYLFCDPDRYTNLRREI